ncbi:MAG: DegV family protein [Clostridia bacterium]|nr:DegV family protein [Clostridia bacterium]
MAIRLIADSTCDITIKDCERMGVELIPLKVTIDGKTYLDKFELTNEEFYEKMAKAEDIPVTTLASPHDFMDKFDEYPDDDIICITVSSKLSGTYQSAVIAKEETGRNNIHIVDSCSVSLGAGILVEYAAKMIENGEKAADIGAKLNEIAPKIELYAAVDTLKYLVKGGRLGKASGAVGSLLGIKPVLRVKDGVIENVSKERGMAKAVAKMKALVEENTDYLENDFPVIYGHSNNESGMESLMAQMSRTGSRYFIGSVVGTHAGPGAVGIAVVNTK